MGLTRTRSPKLMLPDTAPGWTLLLDTTRPEAPPEPAVQGLEVPAHSVLVFAPIFP